MSTNASNFYDRVYHTFSSLTAQHFGVHVDYSLVLLKDIQSMSIFCRLLLAYHLLSTLVQHPFPLKVPVKAMVLILCLWLIISFMILRYLHLKVLVSQHFTPISRSIFILAYLVHVDDTDVNVLNFSNKPIAELITEVNNLFNAYYFPLRRQVAT